MEWDTYESRRWNGTLNMALVKSLLELRNVRLQTGVWDYPQVFKNKEDFFKRNYTCQWMRRLRTLPLTSAEVAVRTSKVGSEDGHEMKSDEEWFADSLQKLLVNPMGAEIYENPNRNKRDANEARRE